MNPLIAVLIGLVAGLTSGLLGIGGGVVMVPSMILVGVDAHVAIATSLMAIIIITLSGGRTHWKLGHVEPKTAVLIAVPAVITAQIGAIVAIATPESTIKGIYAVFLLILSIRFFKGSKPSAERDPHENKAVVILCGVLVGFMASFLGIGGGVIMVLFMTMYLGFDIRKAVGTSTAVIVVVATSGTIQYVYQGVPDIVAGVFLGIGGASTAYIGALLVARIDRARLRRIFALFLIVISMRFLGAFDAVGSFL